MEEELYIGRWRALLFDSIKRFDDSKVLNSRSYFVDGLYRSGFLGVTANPG